MQLASLSQGASARAITQPVEPSGTVPPNSPEFPIPGDDLNQSSPDAAPIPPNSPEFPNGGGDLNAGMTPQDASSDLNDRQRAAIELLVLGNAIGAVARQLEIDRKTLFNWRKLERFNRELARRRRELWDDAGRRLSGLVLPSLDVMEWHLRDAYDRNRFRAASAILRIANLGKSVPPSAEPEGK